MSKPKTIYLHIGSMKTGSTAIRTFLYNNRELLEKKGFLYPVIKDNQYAKEQALSEILSEIENHHIQGKKPLEKVKQDWLSKIQPVINSSTAENIIISSEQLAETNLEIYDFLVALGFIVKVVVYLRKPAEYISSLYAEFYKGGDKFYVPTIMHFLKFEKPNVYNCILNNIRRIGPNNMIIRPYEKEQWKNGHLIEDFLYCVGLDEKIADDYIFCYNDINQTLDVNFVYLCKFINFLNLNRNQLFRIKNILYKIHSNDPALKLIYSLTDEEIEKITNYFLQDINQIEKCLGINNLFLNIMPSCYKQQKIKIENITFSKNELRLLNYAIKIKKLNNPWKKFLYRNKKYGIFNKMFLSEILTQEVSSYNQLEKITKIYLQKIEKIQQLTHLNQLFLNVSPDNYQKPKEDENENEISFNKSFLDFLFYLMLKQQTEQNKKMKFQDRLRHWIRFSI